MQWTEEHDALLRKLCEQEEKLSAPQIAKAISDTFGIRPVLSRASIIGRCHRKGIALPRQRNGWNKRREWSMSDDKPALFSRPMPRLVYDADAGGPVLPQVQPEPRQSKRGQILADDGEEPGVYLLNASDGDCRWPISNPTADMRVCGEPVQAGSRYCVHCHRKAYTSVEPGGGVFVLPTKQRGLK